jgi:hypothetical protein
MATAAERRKLKLLAREKEIGTGANPTINKPEPKPEPTVEPPKPEAQPTQIEPCEPTPV